MNPLVSIIVPTYNRCSDLQVAIESAQRQTYDNFEIVVCDDCSTDGTAEYIHGVATRDPRIKYFRNPVNLKFAGNHKKAIEEYASGEYCMILGDDDYLINNGFIQTAISYIFAHDLVIVGSNYQIHDTQKDVYSNSSLQMDPVFSGVTYLNNRMTKKGWSLFIGASVFNRMCAIKAEPFKYETPAADGEFIDKIVLLGNCGFLECQSICYRVHGGNWSGKTYHTWESTEKLYKIADRVEQFAENLGIRKSMIHSYSTKLQQGISINYLTSQFSFNPGSLAVVRKKYHQINKFTPISASLFFELSLYFLRKISR